MAVGPILRPLSPGVRSYVCLVYRLWLGWPGVALALHWGGPQSGSNVGGWVNMEISVDCEKLDVVVFVHASTLGGLVMLCLCQAHTSFPGCSILQLHWRIGGRSVLVIYAKSKGCTFWECMAALDSHGPWVGKLHNQVVTTSKGMGRSPVCRTTQCEEHGLMMSLVCSPAGCRGNYTGIAFALHGVPWPLG